MYIYIVLFPCLASFNDNSPCSQPKFKTLLILGRLLTQIKAWSLHSTLLHSKTTTTITNKKKEKKRRKSPIFIKHIFFFSSFNQSEQSVLNLQPSRPSGVDWLMRLVEDGEKHYLQHLCSEVFFLFFFKNMFHRKYCSKHVSPSRLDFSIDSSI